MGRAAACVAALLLLLCGGAASRVAAQTATVRLDVPFLPQTEDLCGGAAAAMLFRFWGDTHASVTQFEPLVDHRAGGIADTVLIEALRARRWITERLDGSVETLRVELSAHRPLMLLLEDRPGRYHYVVAVGIDGQDVLLHDPTWGPYRRVTLETLQRIWKPSGFWTLRVTPTRDTIAPEHVPTAPTAASTRPRTACDDRLDAALDDIGAHGLAGADALLIPLADACPDEAGPLRELAGVRFAQERWQEASVLAAAALQRDPHDAYAADVLGSSLFLRGNDDGALRAWNIAGKPILDSVRITGLARTRYAHVAQALNLPVDRLLHPDQYSLARRRLQQFPMFASARLSLRPTDDRFAVADIAAVERRMLPGSPAQWVAATARAGLEREATTSLPGFSGQGEVWSARVSWWEHRPAAALAFTAPFTSGPRGVWRVELGWARQTYGPASPADLREDRLTGSVGLSSWVRPNLRADVSLAADSWRLSGMERFRTIATIAALEQRWLDDRVSMSISGGRWFASDTRAPFGSLAAVIDARTAHEPRRVVLVGTLGGSVASADAPPSLWNGAGDGRARAPLLRAHRLLSDGRIDGAVFGRQLAWASLEGQHWLPRPGIVRLGIAAFMDAAAAGRRPAYAVGLPWQVDVGGGWRIRLPLSTGSFRLDYARGLRDAANRFFIGWTRS